VYAAGYQQGTGTYNYGNGVTATGAYFGGNVLLVKYNSSGQAQWAKTVEAGTNSSSFSSVAVDSSGNVYTAGEQAVGTFNYGYGVTAAGTDSTGSNTVSTGKNIVLVKYNSSGQAQWAKTVEAGTSASMFNSVAVDSSGNVYAAGWLYGGGTCNY
jgi:hypothetical protein